MVRPSPSESAFGAEKTTFKVLLGEATDVELPDALVATTVKDPIVVDANVRVIVAEVPFELMTTFEGTMAVGVKAGRNENVAPLRLDPVTWKLLIVGVWRIRVGLREVITGTDSTVNALLEFAVAVPTVTVIRPVLAPDGTVRVRLLGVAAVTVAAVPLNCAVLALGVVLKFCP